MPQQVPEKYENLIAHVRALDVVHLSVSDKYLIALTTQAQLNMYDFESGEWVLRNHEN